MREKGKILAVVNTGKRPESAVSGLESLNTVKPTFVGVSSNVDLSKYLQKSVWDKVFEIRTDTNNVDYIYSKLPVVTQYGVTMYKGESLNLPSIYDGLPIDGQTIYWENGILKAKGGGGGIESITKQMVIEALGFTPYSAENPNGYITAASIPSSIKNPYALTFGSKTYDGSAAKSITASDLGAALSSDLSKYLPLSGGTISGKLIITHSDYDDILTIKRIHPSGNSIIKYSNSTEFLGHIGVYGSAGTFPYNPIFADKDGNQYKLWHSGNDGSGSGLDADLLDGKHISEISKYIFRSTTAYALSASTDLNSITYDNNNLGYYTTSDNVSYTNAPTTNFGLLAASINGTYVGQLLLPYNSDHRNIYYRSMSYGSNGKIWCEWKRLAYITDNVASATKLQTARKIFGQDFNGTGDVSGALSGVNGITMTGGIKQSAGENIFNAGSTFTDPAPNKAASAKFCGLIAQTGGNALLCTTSGNVGIGTTSPSAKLHVVGNILATGGVTMQSQRSLKNVVDERGLSLAELSNIKPTRYTWKDKRDDRIHFGGIADDIEKVLPEVIYKTSDGTLTMDYGNAGFAIASSLIKPVVDHEERIKALERENKELKERLNRYEA